MRIEGWHTKQALHLASLLPDGIEDARIILKLANELVESFLADREPEPDLANVLTLVKGDGR